jgi:glycosyltransferase involved in cell wall biosynthesis
MKILFIHNALRSFVRIDLEILQSQHTVKVVEYTSNKKYLSEIAEGVKWCDLIFGWWATWHMLPPTLLANRQHKPVIVVGGDYDVIFEKKFRSRKRILLDRLRNGLGYFLFPMIDRFIVNSDFSKRQACKLPYIKDMQVTRIYHGLPDNAAGMNNKKSDLILSIGNVNQYDIYRKGYAAFVKSATFLPNLHFQLIGAWQDSGIDLLRSWNDTNVSYSGYLPDKDLFQAMSDAKVYVQVSHHEGFGMSLAEAMLFQCIPVVTDRGAIPEVVGDCGLYVPYGDPQKTAVAIQQACEQGQELGARARQRILSQFPIENRRHQLLDIIEKTYSDSR